MNRLILLVVVAGLAFTGCKSKKELAQSPYTTDPSSQPKVFTVPASNPQPQAAPKEEPVATVSAPVSMRKEQVSFTRQEDKAENESNNFFVILGSFGELNNAKNFRETLTNRGFTPIILHSETGFYRVCVNSYKNETEARNRVGQVRNMYPEYSDAWLLIKD